MAAREQSGQDISPGVIQRVAAGLRYAFTGQQPSQMDWFGPMKPRPPAAQEQTEGRAFDFPTGFNLRTTPREGEEISFAQLRALADGYDLLRLVIETRKDQVASFEWELVPAVAGDSADKYAAEIKAATEFLQRPDKEHDWDQWLRMQVEDLLVIDAVAVYPRMTRGGGLYALELVDAATIKRVLDANGRTPLPPDPAYQQVLKGIAAAEYTREELIYTMRNPRTNRIYGYGPCEQVLMTVNIAIRRQMSQLDAYTQGNVPEAIAQVPESWTAKQIAEFQTWWDAVVEGDRAAQRKMRFIPSLKDIVFPREQVLKDQYDEWLARIVCFAFSISPSALITQVNRASSEQMADTAKEEGLLPLLRFFATHYTALIQRFLGAPGLRFQFKVQNKIDPKAQAETHGIYVDRKVLTPDEVREDLGRVAMTPQEREAAWPAPPEPPVVVPGEAEAKKPAAPIEGDDDEKESPAEKMLADAIRMLDPSRVAEAIEKAAASQAPRIVEVRPEVNVEVGDTNVHVPVAKPEALNKAAPPKLHAIRTRRMADGSAFTSFEDT